MHCGNQQSPESASVTPLPIMQPPIVMYPVAMAPQFVNQQQASPPQPQPQQQFMYLVPSPLPLVPSNTPAMVTTPQTTPFAVLPSQAQSTPVPKPSFQRQRSAPNLRAVTSPQSQSSDKPRISPFVQQPLASPLANTATILEKLHKSPEERGTENGRRKLHIDPLDGTWGRTEGTLMTEGTLNSLEDILDAKEIAAMMAMQDDPAAVAMVEELRNELTDAGVRTKVLRLPEELCVNMVCVLERQTDLMMDLCMKERGKILAHLVEKLESDQSFPLVKFTLDNFMALALNQSGCIALPRILGCITDSQRDVFFEETKKNLDTLTTHPFGNYIVKHFVQLREKKYNGDVCAFLCNADALRKVSTNKFGSHVLEDLMRHSTPGGLRPFIENAFNNNELLRQMCNDPYANYCIQSMFQFMHECDRDPTFHAFCLKQIGIASQGSKYQKNIMKHASNAFKATKPKGKKSAT